MHQAPFATWLIYCLLDVERNSDWIMHVSVVPHNVLCPTAGLCNAYSVVLKQTLLLYHIHMLMHIQWYSFAVFISAVQLLSYHSALLITVSFHSNPVCPSSFQLFLLSAGKAFSLNNFIDWSRKLYCVEMACALMFDIQWGSFPLPLFICFFLSNRAWQTCLAWGSKAHRGALNTPAGLLLLLVCVMWEIAPIIYGGLCRISVDCSRHGVCYQQCWVWSDSALTSD